MKIILTVSLCLIFIAGCAGMGSKHVTAIAELKPTKGNQAHGLIVFQEKKDKLVMKIELSGLAPGLHGFHIHEKGDCSAPDATSAGGHYNPRGKPHGGPGISERHGGDLGNIEADNNGKANLEIEITGLSLQDEAENILGKSVIVHAARDDLKSQPAGNAGARVACGVITRR